MCRTPLRLLFHFVSNNQIFPPEHHYPLDLRASKLKVLLRCLSGYVPKGGAVSCPANPSTWIVLWTQLAHPSLCYAAVFERIGQDGKLQSTGLISA